MWNIEQLSQALKNELANTKNLSDPLTPFPQITIDSRTLKPGDIFLALRGDHADGHKFIYNAIQRGASAVILDHGGEGIDSIPIFQVKDTFQALQALGNFAREQTQAKIIAITGSAGKTTTKEMTASLLGADTVASPFSFNNHWGVPLSLTQLEKNSRFGVFEVGMNHPGEIAPLIHMIRPHVSIITTIVEAHIGHMGSRHAIAEEKSHIFAGLEPQGYAIIPIDIPEASYLLEKAKQYTSNVITVGQSSQAYVRLIKAEANPTTFKTDVEVQCFDEKISYTLPFLGLHYVQNTLLILGALHALGLSISQYAEKMANLSLVSGRGKVYQVQLTNGKNITLIDDAYNANPASMEAGLNVLKEFPLPPGGRRIAVLGDMLELGEKAEAYHQNLKEPLENAKIDQVYTTGPLMKSLFTILPTNKQGTCADSPGDLLSHLHHNLQEGDIVFVKGSKGSRVRQVVESLLCENTSDVD